MKGLNSMRTEKVLFIVVCIFIFSANITQGQENDLSYFFHNDSIENNTVLKEDYKYRVGFKIGLTRLGIYSTNKWFKVDQISNNYRLYGGAYFFALLNPKYGLEIGITYKQFGFGGESFKFNRDADFDIKINYISSQFIFNYYLLSCGARPSLYAGIDVSCLLSSQENYTTKISSFHISESLKSKQMRNILETISSSLIFGSGIDISLITRFTLSFETEFSIVSPTKNRIYKEGDYNPLPYPFKFVNISLKLRIPIYATN